TSFARHQYVVAVWRLKPAGTEALSVAPFAPSGEVKVPRELEQLLVEQTSNVTWPVSFVSGSPKVALSDGVVVPTNTALAGAESEGVLGGRFAVLFVTATPAVLAAALPVGGAVSRTIGSAPGFVYASVRVSRWWTALASVNCVRFAAGYVTVPVPAIAAPPFGVTPKAEPATDWVWSRLSDHVAVTVVPSAATVAAVIVGDVVSTRNERVALQPEATLELST